MKEHTIVIKGTIRTIIASWEEVVIFVLGKTNNTVTKRRSSIKDRKLLFLGIVYRRMFCNQPVCIKMEGMQVNPAFRNKLLDL